MALCTHNGARYVAEQVTSILNQTRQVHEIVLGDDASTDNTIDIVQTLVAGSNIRLVIRHHDPALRVAANFSDAIGATTGDVIILCDQDDLWYPTKVEHLVEALQDADLVHSDARLVNGEGKPISGLLLDELKASRWERGNLMDGDALAVLLRRSMVTGATAAVRGPFARAMMPVPDGWIHDEWLAICAATAGRLTLIPEVLTDYRQHGGNQIGAKKESVIARVRRMMAPDPVDDHRRITRARTAAQVLPARGIGTRKEWERLQAAYVHQQFRMALPLARLRRIWPIMREYVTGGYRHYSRGILTAARDFVQVREK
ncbi:glycosyltransferase family 2 protein [Schaalia suimastitidis]|uniref:glycosyltransferase family 2 protein n=1 Tax=Schaalia suimastitidis TaxID=121163 RepID=UPI001F0A3660|nr:glycosyltransferase family 2 protein [Schaalia suimastitidis]